MTACSPLKEHIEIFLNRCGLAALLKIPDSLNLLARTY